MALQLLFQLDLNPGIDRPTVERFIGDRLKEQELRTFCQVLYDGVRGNLAAIDEKLTEAAENWRVPRMAAVDRNVLRLGAFELLHGSDTPGPVVVDEAIELARRFGSADSSSFVNGVLDRLLKKDPDHPQPAQDPNDQEPAVSDS